MLKDPEINLIDIVTPPFLHIPMSIKALQAGKHVICEKPLTGYFGKQGEESLKGSSSPVAGQWNKTGGGTLIRTGTHPLSGMLWLKQQEAQARGEEITIESVLADTGTATKILTEHEHRHIAAKPVDVEDYACVSLTFSDGTKCLTIASDTVLGGTKNYIEIYSNDSALTCNITPTDILNTYFLDEEGLDDIYISEMLPAKLGWNKSFVCDEIIRGYAGELKDFLETIYFDREPLSGFEIAYDTVKVIYAAYLSSWEGRIIKLN